MRAEHAAVDVRLVDHHDSEVGEQIAPGAVIGQDPDVEHVRIRQDQIRAAANLRAGLARRVAIVDRRSYPVPQPEGVERPCLILGERLCRVEVERARLGVAQQHVQRRQVEAQRLSRGGAGRRYHGSLPRSLERLELMLVELRDAGGLERLE